MSHVSASVSPGSGIGRFVSPSSWCATQHKKQIRDEDHSCCTPWRAGQTIGGGQPSVQEETA
jgi:hypothetical protein